MVLFFYDCPVFILIYFVSQLLSVNPSFPTNVLAGQKMGMCFVFVTFTGTEGNIDKGLVMGSSDWEGTCK
jgi:hypothetical protein